MSTTLVLIIAFAIFKLFQYLLKGARENQSSHPPQQQRGAMSQYGGFIESETIESLFGFYTFSIDREDKEFIFVTEDKTAYRLPYAKLKNYSIKARSEAVIIIELKTFITTKPIIEIECFNKLKVLPRLDEMNRSVTGLNILYEKEKAKVIKIGEILDEILKENKGNVIELPPPHRLEKLTTEQKVKEVQPTPQPATVNLLDILESAQKKKEEAIIQDIEIENNIELEEIVEELEVEEIEETANEYETIEVPLEAIDYTEEEFTDENVIKEERNEIEEKQEDMAEMVRVSLSDVEYYSRGKFLEPGVQHEVSEAKMRGKKEIFITKEQLERLKE